MDRFRTIKFADLRDAWQRVRGKPLDPRVFPPNRWTLPEVERRIRDEPVEWAYVVDRTGRQVFRARGNPDSVSTVSAVLKDASLIHNHPPYTRYPVSDPRYPGRSFSNMDIALLLASDLATMIVVTPGLRYVILRPIGGWVPDAESAVAYYRDAEVEVRREVTEAVQAGWINAIEVEARVADAVIRRLAEWGSFAYRRERVEP